MSADYPQQSSLSLYQLLARNLPGTCVVMFDEELRFFDVEGEALEEFGCTKIQVEGHTLFEILPPSSVRNNFEKHYRNALCGEESFDEVEHNSNSYLTHTLPIPDDTGNIIAGMMIICKITKLRFLERELVEYKSRFYGLFDNNNDAVFFIGLDDQIEDLNEWAAELLLSTREEKIGTDIRENLIGDEVIPGFKSLHPWRKDEKHPLYKGTFKRRDGSTFLAEVSAALVYNTEGTPLYIQYIVRDITHRKMVEQQLENQLAQLTLLLEVDSELTQQFNAEYVVTLALNSSAQLSGADGGYIALIDDETGQCKVRHNFGDYPIQPGAIIAYDQGITGRTLRKQQPEWVIDVSVDKDYVAIDVQTQSKMVIPMISQNRLIGILNLETAHPEKFSKSVYDLVCLLATRIALSTDNARLYKRVENQLIELQKLSRQVSDLEQLKTDMIRIASHDLRNPLGAIQGYLELIAMDVEASPQGDNLQRYLDQLKDATDMMSKIIHDILALERVQQSVENMEIAKVDLTSLILEVFIYHKTRSTLHHHTLALKADTTNKHIIIEGNEPFLREAMGHLISNAIKYTPKGDIEVLLYIEENHVVFKVVDNGVGIPTTQQDNLFQPFFRVRTKETRNIEGTGLGLHLVKQIVERHSGEIIFQSTYGEGSTFGFKIPMLC